MGKPNDFGAMLAGLTFGEAIERYVFEDGSVREAIELAEKEAMGEKPDFRKYFCDRQRVRIDPENLAKDFANPMTLGELASGWNHRSLSSGISTPRAKEPSESIEAAWRSVLQRYMNLIDLLASGDLLVTGVRPQTGDRDNVDSSFWNDQNLFVNFQNGELSLGLTRSKREILTRGIRFVSLELAVQEQTKSAGGRPPRYPWEDAFERLMIRIGNEGHPETGAILGRWLVDALEQAGCQHLPDADQARKWLKRYHPMLWQYVTGSQSRGGQN